MSEDMYLTREDMYLTREDFKPTNFSIVQAVKNGVEYIYQEPFAYDDKRYAHKNPVVLIGSKPYDVADFDEALKIINGQIKEAIG